MTPPAASRTHLVIIPSYNSGSQLLDTVQAALARWSPVWVVIDGSSDGSVAVLRQRLAAEPGLEPHLQLLEHASNRGKGAAVLTALALARAEGFTHALTMDADGQHPADLIPRFMAASEANPAAMVLGKPVFDAAAPRVRVYGRRISNTWANLETLWSGIGDSLYGFRVYPIARLQDLMLGQRWMRRFDFDPEAVVRLCWAGVRPINLPAPVRYLSAAEGGVSHFRYGRDNLLLTWMHIRLLCGFARRLPVLIQRRRAGG
jgi:glycosyltransferase involved in cell wall biosynthesis